MRVLGIDPGLNITGYGFVEEKNGCVKILEAGIIGPKRTAKIQDRLAKIYSILGELVDEHKPDVLVLEKLYSHKLYPLTSSILGHARGVICLLCAHKGIALSEQSVKRVRKSLLGNGNATKLQVKAAVARALHINEHQLTLDASDALALALGYVHFKKLPNCF